LNRENLKGVTVYFGIGEERPFYIEKVPSLLMERIRLNLSLFYLNYMLLTAVLFVLTLLISPSAIIGIGLLGLAWMYVIKSTQSGSMPIYGTSIFVVVVARVPCFHVLISAIYRIFHFRQTSIPLHGSH
jgi:hypothetical protein